MKSLLIIAVLGAAAIGVRAETAYRCGTTYSQTPCPQAEAFELRGDSRTAAQRADSRRVTAAERRFADDLQRERLAREAAPKLAAARLDRDPIRPAMRVPPKKVKDWKKPKKAKAIKPKSA